MIRVTTTAVLVLAGSALAQYEITIDVENPVLLPGESTTVTMLAGYGGTDFAIAGLGTNLAASVGSEGWSDAAVLDPMDGPGTTAGAASASGYDGIIAGQIHDGMHFYADTSNPIAFWQATYTAPLDLSTPFAVELATITRRYDVYISRHGVTAESRFNDLTEGSATIHVIPAPASALVLAGGILLMRRRR